jgi:hypothetical protein
MTFESLSTASPSHGRRAFSFFFAVAAVVALAAPACNSSSAGSLAGQSESCALNSDCDQTMKLICAFGKCTAACKSDSDCGAGGMCVITAATATAPAVAACQSAAQANMACNSEADCSPPLACASDYRCRNLCSTSADCNVLGISGKVCAVDQNGYHYCADPADVNASGVIDEAPPAGAPDSGVIEPVLDSGGSSSSSDATMSGSGGSGGSGSSGSSGASSSGASSGASSGSSGASSSGSAGACSASNCGVGHECTDAGCVVCGSQGDPCCGGSTCGTNLSCVSGTCSCGSPGEACCNGTTCSNSVTCSAGVCACGAAGTACCPSGSASACMGALQCAGADCTCQTACSGSVVQLSDGTLYSYYNDAFVTNSADSKVVATNFSVYYETSTTGGLGCYVDSSGSVWCWGGNSYGELGNATTTASATPVQVLTSPTGPALSNIKSVYVDATDGYVACAIDTNTDVWCWGYGYYGTLGSGYTYNSDYATQVVTTVGGTTPFTGAVSLSVAEDHVCATTGTAGSGAYELWCWGSNNYGQIGTGSQAGTSYLVPTQVSDLYSSVVDVSVGEYLTCAVTTDSSVYCWGYNGYGNLGNGLDTGNAYVPTQVLASTGGDGGTATPFSGAASVQVGGYYYSEPCVRKTDGSIWCWGEYSSSTTYLPAPYLYDSMPVRQTYLLCPNGGEGPSYIDVQGHFNYSSSLPTQVSCP